MRTLRRTLLTAALVLFPMAARAGGPDANVEKGKALYEEAVKLLDAKKYGEACPKLEESVKLVPVAVGARMALGECEEGRGRLVTAMAVYRQAQALAAAAGQPDREKAAREKADALQARAGTVEIALSAADASLGALAVELDGKRLDATALRVPIPVDAGKHTVRATAEGRDPFESSVDVKDGAKSTLTVTLQLPGQGAPALPSGTAAPTATGAPGGGTSPLRIAGIAGGALGLAGLALGGAMGGVAISKNGASNPGTCTPTGVCNKDEIEARHAAYDFAGISTGAFIAGGVLLAAGVTLFVLAPTGKKGEKAARATVSLAAVPGGVTVSGGF